jgi:hypothetical protein
MKYGTITEQHMRHTRTNQFTFEELFRGLTAAGWLRISPDLLLAEIA